MNMAKLIQSCVVFISLLVNTNVFGAGDTHYPIVDCELMVLPSGYTAYLPIELLFDATTGCHTPSSKKEITTSFYHCGSHSYYVQELGNGKCKKTYYGCAGGYSVVNKASGESAHSIDFETIFDCVDPNKQFGGPTCSESN
jgi:hypothetical protein